jgi:hypothetical protein
LVGQDGVQYPPICFPKGSHLLQFLTCLETGLLPYGVLDPPLWNEEGKGKVLPKYKNIKNNEQPKQQVQKIDKNNNELKEDDYEAKDFVFRIISNSEGKLNVWLLKTKNMFHLILRMFFF